MARFHADRKPLSGPGQTISWISAALQCELWTFQRGKERGSSETPQVRVQAQGLRVGISICFHPNRRASIDHAPGPSKSSAAPRVAIRIPAHGSPGPQNTSHTPAMDARAPALGVHKPAINDNPRITSAMWARNTMKCGPVRCGVSSSAIREIPHTRRMSRRPMPGQPRAKFENRRRRKHP